MTDTPNLGLPYIDGGQAQKHVTHNEALRILDAAIQIAVRDVTRTSPPASPADGARYVVAVGATGAWAGHARAIATWQDGAWAFLAPKPGWCVWSVADDGMLVFDGVSWRAVGTPSLDGVPHLGINTLSDASNLLSVKSNAALIAAITAAEAGSGDVRLQLSKESAAKTASVLFATNFSARAEFGLVGADTFKLKISADGVAWTEALVVDGQGAVAMPRALALSGVIGPPIITADQNDYNPAGLAGASVLQIAADATRNISGLAGGFEGRVVSVINLGGQPVTLLNESASSVAANRFTFGGAVALAPKGSLMLRYDGTAARWQTMATGQPAVLRSYLAGLTLSTAGASASFSVSAGVAADSGNADMMTLAAACTKTTAAWAVGTGAGALDTGTIATSTWYHVHLIKRADSGVVDVLISTSATAPVLPTGYGFARRIGAMKTNGSGQWIKFVQSGDKFVWDVPVNDINVVNPGTAAVTRTLPSVPRGIVSEAILSVTAGASAAADVPVAIYLSDLAVADTSGLGVGGVADFEIYNAGSSPLYGGASVRVNTNTVQQVRSRQAASGATSVLSISVTGWTDTRGKNN